MVSQSRSAFAGGFTFYSLHMNLSTIQLLKSVGHGLNLFVLVQIKFFLISVQSRSNTVE